MKEVNLKIIEYFFACHDSDMLIPHSCRPPEALPHLATWPLLHGLFIVLPPHAMMVNDARERGEDCDI